MIKEASTPIGEKICSGVEMVYQEFDLLWLAALPDDEEEEEMSVKAFETAFATPGKRLDMP